MFSLYVNIIKPRRNFSAFSSIEGLRQKLLGDEREIPFTDLGAGSNVLKGSTRKIADLASVSGRDVKTGELLFALADHFHPACMIELGTSLGLGTAYLALAVPTARIFSAEGSPAVAAEAEKNLKMLGAGNVNIFSGEIGEFFVRKPWGTQRPEMVLIDANHTYAATLEYFAFFRDLPEPPAMIVFDDIRWSPGMKRAWEEIVADKKVTVSLDLFSVGIVFLNREQAKEHFVLSF